MLLWLEGTLFLRSNTPFHNFYIQLHYPLIICPTNLLLYPVYPQNKRVIRPIKLRSRHNFEFKMVLLNSPSQRVIS